MKRVLVLGTQTTVSQKLYQNCAETVFYPNLVEQQETSQIIDRVLLGKYLKRDYRYLLNLRCRYIQAQLADEVVLGCTELSVLYEKTAKEKLDVFVDPLKLLATALVRGEN